MTKCIPSPDWFPGDSSVHGCEYHQLVCDDVLKFCDYCKAHIERGEPVWRLAVVPVASRMVDFWAQKQQEVFHDRCFRGLINSEVLSSAWAFVESGVETVDGMDVI